MSVTCNTCGASIAVSASNEEHKKFMDEHFGANQPEWHRQKRIREDAEAKRTAERWLRRAEEVR